jgi:hypothetical protein
LYISGIHWVPAWLAFADAESLCVTVEIISVPVQIANSAVVLVGALVAAGGAITTKQVVWVPTVLIVTVGALEDALKVDEVV